jgi:hypothetical protein
MLVEHYTCGRAMPGRQPRRGARVYVVTGRRYVDAFFRRLSRRYYPPHAPRTPRDGVYFLHIPKTAGSSIGRYFERSVHR